mgnify:CR=1 FL=1
MYLCSNQNKVITHLFSKSSAISNTAECSSSIFLPVYTKLAVELGKLYVKGTPISKVVPESIGTFLKVLCLLDVYRSFFLVKSNLSINFEYKIPSLNSKGLGPGQSKDKA